MIGIWRSGAKKNNSEKATLKEIVNISKKIQKIFPNSNPILVNSGRSSIYLCLKAQKSKRENLISYSPYSSACVLKSISEIASPIPSNQILKNKIYSQIVYHQWGFAKKTKYNSKIIEDSIDSFFLNEKGLFINNSDYEIISLSKLFGLSSGAIIFCKNKNLKEKIIDILIDENFSEDARIIYKKENPIPSYYSNLDLNNPWITKNLINETEKILFNYKKISELKIYKNKLFNKFIPKKLLIETNRLPTIIPLIINDKKLKAIKNIAVFKSNCLHFNFSNLYSEWNLKKVFPLPLHEEIKFSNLKKILNILEK